MFLIKPFLTVGNHLDNPEKKLLFGTVVSKNESFRKKASLVANRKGFLNKKNSGQQDLNLRPLGPQPSALPSYAIPREQKLLYQKPAKKQPENIVRNIQKRKRTRRFRRSFQFFIKTGDIRHVQ